MNVLYLTSIYYLVDSLNCSFENGELANTQKQGNIKLIEKKNKDKRCIANWRPISLLNVNVKIASKALTLRLEKFLSELINADQCAYVKGTNIFDAVRTIGDIMDYTKLHNLSGLIVTIDFEKAFDSAEPYNCHASIEIRKTMRLSFHGHVTQALIVCLDRAPEFNIIRQMCKWL